MTSKAQACDLDGGGRLLRNPRLRSGSVYGFHDIISIAGARRAHREISSWRDYGPTPLTTLPGAAALCGAAAVHYKDEASRLGLGSFKGLGGAYAAGCLLAAHVGAALGRPVDLAEIEQGCLVSYARRVTLACASDGNHGRAVAAAARRFGCGCVVFLHAGVSPGREEAIAALGARTVRVEGDYDDSVEEARAAAAAAGWILVSDTSDAPGDPTAALVMNGYAAMMIEVLEQLDALSSPPLTHVFVQGGVGGLAAAVTAHLWEALGPAGLPRVIVVEPERADCLFQSAENGAPTKASGDLETLMAGLSCGEVSLTAWPILDAGVEFFMTLPDQAAVDAMRRLARGALGAGPIVAGESGAAGLAGLLRVVESGQASAVGIDTRSVVLVIGTEGATDPVLYNYFVRDEEPQFEGRP